MEEASINPQSVYDWVVISGNTELVRAVLGYQRAISGLGSMRSSPHFVGDCGKGVHRPVGPAEGTERVTTGVHRTGVVQGPSARKVDGKGTVTSIFGLGRKASLLANRVFVTCQPRHSARVLAESQPISGGSLSSVSLSTPAHIAQFNLASVSPCLKLS